MLWDSPKPAGSQVKTEAGQLLSPSFLPVAGLGLKILGLTHQLLQSLQLPVSHLTPFKGIATILPTGQVASKHCELQLFPISSGVERLEISHQDGIW